VGVWDYVVVSVWSGRERRKEREGKRRKERVAEGGVCVYVCVCGQMMVGSMVDVFNTTMKVDESLQYHAIAARDRN
jgi:hypothetical protein